MKGVKLSRDKDGRLCIERFALWRRVEHIVTILVFTALVLTGFPQKFYDTAWAASLLELFGGLDQARVIHRVAGIAMAVQLVIHISVFLVGVLTRRMRMSLVPTPQDLRDAWQNLRFYFGLREKQPPMPKFDYRQKFEYIGMVMGTLVMVATGVILMWPVESGGVIGGEALAASRIAHSNEAVLALLVIVVWHIYSSVLAPDVFPLDKSMFTGTMTVDELKHHHRREYDRIFPAGHPDDLAEVPVEASKAEAEPTPASEPKPEDEAKPEGEPKPEDEAAPESKEV